MIYTVEDLKEFEQEIADIYSTGVIKGPIHLRSGNEKYLIKIFEKVQPDDYKFATWANHLEALLSGIPSEAVKKRILEGKSMAMNFPEYKFFTSAIVGGIAPIALGTALALKRQGKRQFVYCFVGDMAAMGGAVNECMRYGYYHDLPLVWVVSDNDKSVGTPTSKVWNDNALSYIAHTFHYGLPPYMGQSQEYIESHNFIYYRYRLDYAHSGIGSFIDFKSF